MRTVFNNLISRACTPEAVVSGQVLTASGSGLLIIPDFDPDVTLRVKLTENTRRLAAMLAVRDRVEISGGITFTRGDSPVLVAENLTRMTKASGSAPRNYISVSARPGRVTRAGEIFRVQFAEKLNALRTVTFRIDREKLNPEALRAFGFRNERQKFTLSGELKFLPGTGRTWFLVSGIAAA